jgi:two-component system, OmpR family, sensor histidine kinase BaeS
MAVAFNTMAEELERQRELRHRTTADVAHELRTPLSVLQIELESIEDGIIETTPESIAGLKAEVYYLNNLVEDLRMLSLVDAGELTVDLQRENINDLVTIVVKRLHEAAREAGVVLEAHLTAEPIWVMADDQRLVQVMFNLISNALNHTPEDGLVFVSVGSEIDEVQIKVQDNGVGIPEADIPFIFERLYRINRARSRDKGGSGLGLAIARSFVEAHGGRIWVESQEGEGSKFIFRLPRADQA